MAGIFSRIKDIMESNIHAALDKCENPEKMLDQMLRKAKEDLAEVREATAQVMADEKAAQRAYDDALKKADGEHQYAVNALKSGDEAAAQKFLDSEARIRNGILAQAEQTLNAAKANTQQMKDAHNKLCDDIDFMQGQLGTIKGTMKVAKATDTVNRIAGTKRDAAASFQSYADKANRMRDEAQARADLNAGPKDSMDGLREKYASPKVPGGSAALDALKAELGMGSGSQENQ
ncbi:MAG: PspA/IM30 family protein [Muribaculaceae bacterium]|nr:PspA/IM30 family protein [Muribaculaceae bacterium]